VVVLLFKTIREKAKRRRLVHPLHLLAIFALSLLDLRYYLLQWVVRELQLSRLLWIFCGF
jgi:hypothetical protein